MILNPNKVVIQNLTQGSSEWLDYRLDKIGASEFASYAGSIGLSNNYFNDNVFKLIYTKLRNKYQTYRSNYKSVAIEIGTVLEDYIRDYLFTTYKIEAVPAVIESKEYPFIFSSLDGIDLINEILIEIKTTSHVENIIDLLQYYLFQVIHQIYTVNMTNEGELAKLVMLNLNNFDGFNYDSCLRIFSITKEDNTFIVLDDSNNVLVKQDLSRESWFNHCSTFYSKLKKLEQELYVNRPERSLEISELKFPKGNTEIEFVNSKLLSFDNGGSINLIKKYLK